MAWIIRKGQRLAGPVEGGGSAYPNPLLPRRTRRGTAPHGAPVFGNVPRDLLQSRLRSSAMSAITATTVPRMRTAASM
jgi:hypothetical protein